MKCAATTLSSKLVAHQKDFFAKLVVDAVMDLDELLPLNMIGIKKVQGGALEVRAFLSSSGSHTIVLFSGLSIDPRRGLQEDLLVCWFRNAAQVVHEPEGMLVASMPAFVVLNFL